MASLQVWTARPDGELDWANQECVQYFDADIETEILGNAWAQFVHPDDLPSSLAGDERYEVEFRLRRQDGEYRWFLVRAQAARDESGAITQWFGTNTDENLCLDRASEGNAAMPIVRRRSDGRAFECRKLSDVCTLCFAHVRGESRTKS